MDCCRCSLLMVGLLGVRMLRKRVRVCFRVKKRV